MKDLFKINKYHKRKKKTKLETSLFSMTEKGCIYLEVTETRVALTLSKHPSPMSHSPNLIKNTSTEHRSVLKKRVCLE